MRAVIKVTQPMRDALSGRLGPNTDSTTISQQGTKARQTSRLRASGQPPLPILPRRKPKGWRPCSFQSVSGSFGFPRLLLKRRQATCWVGPPAFENTSGPVPPTSNCPASTEAMDGLRQARFKVGGSRVAMQWQLASRRNLGNATANLSCGVTATAVT